MDLSNIDFKELLLQIVFYVILITLVIVLLKEVGIKLPIIINLSFKELLYMSGMYYLLNKGSQP